MSIGDHLHMGDASTEGPSQSAKECEIGNALQPILASGKHDRRHGSERAWNHGAGLMPKISTDAPADRERKGRAQNEDERANGFYGLSGGERIGIEMFALGFHHAKPKDYF